MYAYIYIYSLFMLLSLQIYGDQNQIIATYFLNSQLLAKLKSWNLSTKLNHINDHPLLPSIGEAKHV